MMSRILTFIFLLLFATDALATLVEGRIYSTKGYYTPGDGGGADYLIVAGDTGDGFVNHTVNGGTHTAVLQHSGIINIAQCGGTANGATTNTGAIEQINTMGYVALIPTKTYLVDTITLDSFMSGGIVGVSKHESVLKLADGQDDNVIHYVGASNQVLNNITLDGNRTNQAAGHIIRFGGCDKVDIHDVILKNGYNYGIGFQAGANKKVTIDNFVIHTVGRDGIDIKDYELDNSEIIISNGVIYNHGLNEPQQVGIDVRGPAIISDIHILCQNPDTRGIRLRSETVQGRAGSGAISNVIVKATDINTGTYGLDISAGVKDYVVTNFVSDGGNLAGTINGSGGLIQNFSGRNFVGDGLSILGSNLTIRGLQLDTGTRGIDLEPGAVNNNISDFNITGITGSEAIRIQSTSDGNEISHGYIDVGKTINDAGSGTTIRGVRNWKTAVNLISDDLLVDTIGTKTVTLNHGLQVTPSPEDVTLSIIRSTGNPTDYRIGLIHIDNTTSTNIIARVVVTTPTAISGGAVKLAFTVRAKNS